MVASTVFEADSARCFHSNAWEEQISPLVKSFQTFKNSKIGFKSVDFFLSLLPLCDGCILTDT